MKGFPTLPQVSTETLAIIAGTLLAAWVISRFPSLQTFVTQNSVTVRTSDAIMGKAP